MVFKKKKKSVKELEKELRKAQELEQLKEEQNKPTPVMDSANLDIPPPPPPKPEAEKQELSKEELEEIKGNISYYQKNFMGIFRDGDFRSVNVEIASLLFGILIELKKLNDKN